MISIDPATASFDDLRRWIGTAITQNPNGGRLWDVLVCLRGPDSPSEVPGMGSREYSAAYQARRARKYDGVEIIRSAAFFGMCGGSARRHQGTTVVVNANQDHHDRHLVAAAQALGLKVKVRA